MSSKVTVKQIEDACAALVPELERINNWYGYRSDGFPWRNLWDGGRVHLPGVGWLRRVEAYEKSGADIGRYGPNGFINIIIFRVEGDEQLFMKTGWWNSWDENPYDGGLDLVERYEKTVIDYRKVD